DAVQARNDKETQRLIAVKNQKEAESQHDRAEKNLQQAFKAGEVLLTRVSEDRLLREPRMEGLRKDILLKAVRFYEGFYATEGATAAVRWQAARAHRRVGDIQEVLRNYDEAKKSYGKAIGLLGPLLHEPTGTREYRAVLATTHH